MNVRPVAKPGYPYWWGFLHMVSEVRKYRFQMEESRSVVEETVQGQSQLMGIQPPTNIAIAIDSDMKRARLFWIRVRSRALQLQLIALFILFCALIKYLVLSIMHSRNDSLIIRVLKSLQGFIRSHSSFLFSHWGTGTQLNMHAMQFNANFMSCLFNCSLLWHELQFPVLGFIVVWTNSTVGLKHYIYFELRKTCNLGILEREFRKKYSTVPPYQLVTTFSSLFLYQQQAKSRKYCEMKATTRSARSLKNLTISESWKCALWICALLAKVWK